MESKKSASRKQSISRLPVTGVRLPSELVLEAKHRALDERRTLREVVETALRLYLRWSDSLRPGCGPSAPASVQPIA